MYGQTYEVEQYGSGQGRTNCRASQRWSPGTRRWWECWRRCDMTWSWEILSVFFIFTWDEKILLVFICTTLENPKRLFSRSFSAEKRGLLGNMVTINLLKGTKSWRKRGQRNTPHCLLLYHLLAHLKPMRRHTSFEIQALKLILDINHCFPADPWVLWNDE